MLNTYIQFSKLINDAFFNDTRFVSAFDKTFQELINSEEVLKIEPKNLGIKRKMQSEFKWPILLANYCDLLLSKSMLTRKISVDEIDEKLGSVVSLF